MTTLLYLSLAAALVYEVSAALSERWPTISELTWRLIAIYPRSSFLFGLGFGLLLGHLFLR